MYTADIYILQPLSQNAHICSHTDTYIHHTYIHMQACGRPESHDMAIFSKYEDLVRIGFRVETLNVQVTYVYAHECMYVCVYEYLVSIEYIVERTGNVCICT